MSLICLTTKDSMGYRSWNSHTRALHMFLTRHTDTGRMSGDWNQRSESQCKLKTEGGESWSCSSVGSSRERTGRRTLGGKRDRMKQKSNKSSRQVEGGSAPSCQEALPRRVGGNPESWLRQVVLVVNRAVCSASSFRLCEKPQIHRVMCEVGWLKGLHSIVESFRFLWAAGRLRAVIWWSVVDQIQSITHHHRHHQHNLSPVYLVYSCLSVCVSICPCFTAWCVCVCSSVLNSRKLRLQGATVRREQHVL